MGSITTNMLDNLYVEKLNEYLKINLGLILKDLRITPFSGGQSNPTFLVQSSKTNFVLRKKPSGFLLPKAHQIEREFLIMDVLFKHGFRVPQPIHLCTDSLVLGTPFYLMQYVEGEIYQSARLDLLPPSDKMYAYISKIKTLGYLHSFDWTKLNLDNFGKSNDYIKRQLSIWSKQYKSSEITRIEEMDQLINWLPQFVPAELDATIVHGDYRFGNLILKKSKYTVCSVIDWELSTLGNPMSDLAYACLPYHIPHSMADMPEGLLGLNLDKLGIPSEDFVLAIYEKQSGKKIALSNWPFYIAFSLFRLAAISQGVYARNLRGNSVSPKAVQFQNRAINLARLAWKKLKESYSIPH